MSRAPRLYSSPYLHNRHFMLLTRVPDESDAFLRPGNAIC
jgi:hypothetical protein